jgi:tRNA(Ser,Leu) C12 N-acetylase TAN1
LTRCIYQLRENIKSNFATVQISKWDAGRISEPGKTIKRFRGGNLECYGSLAISSSRLLWFSYGCSFVVSSLYMAQELQQQIAKFIVTSRGLEPARHFRFALRNAIRGARVRGTGFRGVLALETEGEVSELAKLICRECSESVGHLTAVLATVESREEPIKDAAAQIGAAQIGPEESFCFRLHKRGAHGLERDTSKLDQEIGAAIWTALEEKYHKKPKVSLKNPDVTVIAEILGPIAAVGISRKAWRE